MTDEPAYVRRLRLIGTLGLILGSILGGSLAVLYSWWWLLLGPALFVLTALAASTIAIVQQETSSRSRRSSPQD